jgi:hypothetical protein
MGAHYLIDSIKCICIKQEKWPVMYVGAMDIDYTSFYDFDIWFWNFSDTVVFFAFHLISSN